MGKSESERRRRQGLEAVRSEAVDPQTDLLLRTILWVDTDGIHDFVIEVRCRREGRLLARVDTAHDLIHLHVYADEVGPRLDDSLMIQIPERSKAAVKVFNNHYWLWYQLMEDIMTRPAKGGDRDADGDQ